MRSLFLILFFSLTPLWAQDEPPLESDPGASAPLEPAPSQESPSPVMESPPPPPSSAEQGRPGTPSRVQPPAGDGVTDKLDSFGPSNGHETEPTQTAESSAPAPAPKAVPDEYVIQNGDTLWDICGKFMDNPWYWPKLWSLNQYIANPHLIYPGDKLSFYSGSQTMTPRLDVLTEKNGKPVDLNESPRVREQREELKAPVAAVSSSGSALPQLITAAPSVSVKLKSLAFITPKELETAGYVSHSGEPKMMLVAGDRLYLEFKKKQNVSVGDRFHAFEVIQKVKNPDTTWSNLGHLVRKKAVIRIVAIQKNTVEGTITDTDDTIVRGDRIIPYISPVRTVIPHKTEKELAGKIVAAEHQQFLISNNDFVYLNLGKKQGIDDGLQLVVVRRGDGAFPNDDQHLPDVVVGRLLIVETKDQTSTAYITDLRDSLLVGDRVRNKID